ncbi:MAG: LacI family transcriptional regulator [Spirochaetales bacterium]|jgi:LacI family transcriptional regulator|nr:LacI family transcriptional regulator [Spirochaetales bacterium]
MTSREIARLAGVSVSTVSIVLNGKPGVSEETRTRVMDILEQNGFSLNMRNPVALQGGVIRFCKIAKHGQIVNDRHNAFISDYTDGIIEEAKLHGLSVEVATFNGSSLLSVSELIRVSHGLTGCIILATELSQGDIDIFDGIGIPFVFLDAMYEFSPHDFVTMDNMKMTFDMVRHLYELGHRKIGMLYNEGGSNFGQRKTAFIRALASLGLSFREDWMLRIGSTHETAQSDMYRQIQGKKDLPTAFFASNDMIAAGAIAALQSLHYKVPEDISVGGFDDIPVASFIDPPLTTISVPKFDIGRLAVSVLLDKIKKRGVYLSQKSVLAGKLLVRKSTSPVLQGQRI